jgi:hypothetical protein
MYQSLDITFQSLLCFHVFAISTSAECPGGILPTVAIFQRNDSIGKLNTYQVGWRLEYPAARDCAIAPDRIELRR